MRTTPDGIVVTAGAQGAFDLCARTFLRPGDVVAVELPGYAPCRAAMHGAGARLVGVPVDGEGIRVDLIPPDARLVHVTPSHQAPTGSVLSASRRRQLLDLAARQDMLIIEDDYDTEFRYVDRPLEPLHRMDTDGRVVYVGSFSKTLSPSLRVGFAVAAPGLVDSMVAVRRAVDLQPPHLVQAALAELIATRRFEAHLRRCRRAYRARRDLVVDHLGRMSDAGLVRPGVTCHAGLHTYVRLNDDVDPDAVVEQLARLGVVVEAATESWIGPPAPALVIGFGLASPADLESALGHLARVLVDADGRPAFGSGSIVNP